MRLIRPATSEGKGSMYCVACGTQLPPGLSYCNRCGTSLSRDRESSHLTTRALTSSIVIVALVGLLIMMGGAIVLRKGGDLNNDAVGMFMVLCFLIIGMVELLLLRQLSRATGGATQRPVELPSQYPPAADPSVAAARKPATVVSKQRLDRPRARRLAAIQGCADRWRRGFGRSPDAPPPQ